MTYFLAIESSCDETAAAVFTDDLQILSNVVASQNELHSRFGGVVPEIASRAHLRNIIPVIDEALSQARITLGDVGCMVVHNTPGLVGALLIGVSAAKMIALARGIPLIAVNHVASHIYACRLAAKRDIFPCVGLVVSGGHTSLFHCQSALSLTFLGGTRDDAAGEAFDKVAAILGLGFPGGPAVEREARTGNPTAFAFPRAFSSDGRLEFSFSGLKTAVLYACHGQNVAKAVPPPPSPKRADLAASFQEAVVDALVLKCKQALRQTGLQRLAVGGGVIANTRLRTSLEECVSGKGSNCSSRPWRGVRTMPPWPRWPLKNGGSASSPRPTSMPSRISSDH
ncbi:MAG: tRNA (adenosine(37)-N6)-threonylcarbamoyltransferase complex transferase subunit TsaD [Gemmataceae bacterium]